MSAKCIMVQGTSSSVGKSFVTAGLCRIFKQQGYRVAPFKSQNIALNSFVTRDGKEMGRAQVVQAEAAGIEPSVEMNPILLKPSGGDKTQVIINGEVYGNVSFEDYEALKPRLKDLIKAAYNKLSADNDIIVIEGAGSPAEINLKENDIVNMGVAELVRAPVILVGNIDRGGVFASLAGTLLLLEESERTRVKGVIINKFIGDYDNFRPGIKMLENIIKVPVLGVLPYFRHNIEDEDGYSYERFTHQKENKNNDIDIAIIKLPYMSNFTDFNPLENIKGVCIRYIHSSGELDKPDMIILPGSKSTISDLEYLRASGIGSRINELNAQGVIVFGICGGLQMLGHRISDPFGNESDKLDTFGLGLLDMSTILREKKTTIQVEAGVVDSDGLMKGLNGLTVKGYEIHYGSSEFSVGCVPFLTYKKPKASCGTSIAGVRNKQGTVFGTYIHGIFEEIGFTAGIIDNLRKSKGLNSINADTISFNKHKQEQYDMLADILRNNLDMDAINNIIGI